MYLTTLLLKIIDTSNGLTAFNSDGFTLGNPGTELECNDTPQLYAAWSWDAGT